MACTAFPQSCAQPPVYRPLSTALPDTKQCYVNSCFTVLPREQWQEETLVSVQEDAGFDFCLFGLTLNISYLKLNVWAWCLLVLLGRSTKTLDPRMTLYTRHKSIQMLASSLTSVACKALVPNWTPGSWENSLWKRVVKGPLLTVPMLPKFQCHPLSESISLAHSKIGSCFIFYQLVFETGFPIMIGLSIWQKLDPW